MRGLFITLEGLEGAGKSSLVPAIRDCLLGMGRGAECFREPGGTPVAEAVRAILKTPRDDESIDVRAEVLLMYAARAQLVNTRIRPALERGTDVICDRHDLSSVAYQGGGRGVAPEILARAREIAIGDFRPDLTLLLDLDPAVGLARVKDRGGLDRFERSGAEFFYRTRRAYLDYARAHGDVVRIVDAARPPDEVRREALALVRETVQCLSA